MRLNQWHWAFFLLAWGTVVCAQEIPRIRHFTPSDYKAQNQNWSLATSEQGWIYAGNNSGLIEMDGSNAQTYFLPDKQTVRCVATGAQQVVFCGGMGEFGFWKPAANGLLEYTSLSRDIINPLQNEEIWHILVLPNAVLFQSFSTLYRYDYQKVTVIQPPGNIMFAHGVHGKVLVPVIGKGIYELLPDQTFRFLEHTAVLADKWVQFLMAGDNGTVWAGTANHGIYAIGTNDCAPLDNPLNGFFKQFQLNKAIALRQGGWIIGTILNGVYVLDKNQQLQYHIYRENGLQNNTVLAITEDQNGNVWLGLDRGIDCIALGNPLRVFDDQTGQIGTVYAAATFEGRLYIGTNHGVFYRNATSNGGLWGEKFKIIEGTQGQIWQLQVFGDELICGHNSGTFSIKNGQARRISSITGGWCTIEVPGRPGVLLQSTYSALVVFRQNATRQWTYSHSVNGVNTSLKKIYFDDKGQLWGEHANKGFFQIQLNETLTEATATPAQKPRDNGVITLPGVNGEYFTADSSGVHVFTPQAQGHFPLFLVPKYEQIAAISDSQYLFCLENGYALLHRRQMAGFAGNDSPAPVIRRIATGQGELLPLRENMALDWHQNTLKFRFSVPFFDHPPQYSWKLEGLSEQWSPWQTDAEKEFINLPEGQYVLMVRSDAGPGIGQFPFEILAPWYRSGWAYLGYTLLLGGLFFLFERYNRLRLVRQREKLEAEKERELAIQKAQAEKEILMLEVENKNRDLSNAAFNLIRKNEALQGLKEELAQSAKGTGAMDKIIRHIDEHLEGDHDWEIFEASFNQVHNDFFKRLKQDYPELTPGDLRLAAYLKMNLSSKEIAPLFNITIRGVENKRYRLRKKLGLPEDANLTEFMLSF
jgi:DNA-binding CsgD family transcriptional regulator